LDKKIILTGFGAFVVILSSLILGFAGFNAALAFILLFYLPFALVISKFNFSNEETLILAIFFSLPLIPTLLYYPGLLISLRLLAVVLVILSIVFFFSYKKD